MDLILVYLIRHFVILGGLLSIANAVPIDKASARSNHGLPPDEVPMQGFRDGDTEKTNWNNVGQNELKWALNRKPNMGVAKNLILFIGDGMGVSTVTAARMYKSQLRGLVGYDALLEWEKFENIALAMHYTTDAQTADSAGTATAILCGEKTRNSMIGVNQHTVKGNCSSQKGNELRSTLKHAMDAGKWGGIVTTARLSHATPASAYASSASRKWETDAKVPEEDRGTCVDIAAQLIDDPDNQRIRVLLGGGRRHFYPEGTLDPEHPQGKPGTRLDGRNLTDVWLNQKRDLGLTSDQFAYVMRQDEFDEVDENKVEYLLGMFQDDHMQYELHRTNQSVEQWGEPSLAEMTEKAIKILQRGPEGFFLLVEGARIDKAHHKNWAQRALNETLAMSDAVKRALELVDTADTLVVTTADHSHGFTVNGGPYIANNVLGLADDYNVGNIGVDWRGLDDKPYLTLGYFSGPGFEHHRRNDGETITARRNLTGEEDEIAQEGYRFDASIWTDSAVGRRWQSMHVDQWRISSIRRMSRATSRT